MVKVNFDDFQFNTYKVSHNYKIITEIKKKISVNPLDHVIEIQAMHTNAVKKT